MPKEPEDLKAKLKKADLEIRNYVTGLEAENLKLHRTIAKLQVQDTSNNNRIKALKKTMEENRPPAPTITVISPALTEENLIEQLRGRIPTLIKIAPKLGLKIVRA